MAIPFQLTRAEIISRVIRIKGVLLFIAILFVKISIAQVELPSDTINAKSKKPVPYHAENDTIVQSPISSDTVKNVIKFGSDQIVKDTIAPPALISDTLKNVIKLGPDQVAKDSIRPQTNKNQKRYDLINKKITEDSIALSKAIQRSYKLIKKNSNAQLNALTFDVGEVFSTFKFTDSQGNKGQNYTHNVTNSYSLGYLYSKNNNLFYLANIGFRGAGASLVNDGTNYSWTIQYMNFNIGIGYMLNSWRIKPYFSASPYFGYMLKGNQTIGTVNYDLLQNKSLKTSDFGLFFSPGLKFALSNSISFYAEYKYILGLQNIETSTTQKSYNQGFSINFGIAITIEKP